MEVNGVLKKVHIRFRDDEHLIGLVQRIATQVGRRIDESCPMVDARLSDGSRVNAVIRPALAPAEHLFSSSLGEITVADMVRRAHRQG